MTSLDLAAADAGPLPSCQAAGQETWADLASDRSFASLTSGRDLNGLREHRRTTALGSLAAHRAS